MKSLLFYDISYIQVKWLSNILELLRNIWIKQINALLKHHYILITNIKNFYEKKAIKTSFSYQNFSRFRHK